MNAVIKNYFRSAPADRISFCQPSPPLPDPENILHQKMQERLINGVVPLIAQLIVEGNESGIFETKYPKEAAEMIMLYGNIAFDDNENLTPRQKKQKGKAFIYNIEKMIGAKAGSLEKSLLQFF